jgi:hypothetical protein
MRFKTLQTSYKLTVTGADDTSLLYISRVFLLLFSLYLKSIHTVLPVLATLSADCTSKFGHNLGSSPPSSSLVTTNLLQYGGNCTCIDEGRWRNRRIYLLHVYLHRESRLRLMARMKMAACMRICIACIRIRMMRLMSDSAYAYAYRSLYIYGPSTLEKSAKSIKKSPNHPK